MTIRPEPTVPGQESVWSYPRPAIAEPTGCHLLVQHAGSTLAETRRAIRTLETSHPPSYYFPPDDVAAGLMRRSAHQSFCEWKGDAIYFDVVINGQTLSNVAWSYPAPSRTFLSLKDHIAFYPAPFDGCFVDGERVTPQPGSFYGGWITSHVAGPFKGIPGSRFW